jgi:hypothetical protein
MPPRTLAFLIAAAVTIGVYLAARLAGRGDLVRGADGRPSTSKAQWWIWTAVVIFGYVAVFVERWLRGDPSAGIEVPHNLLLAMGFSATTMAVAKGITTTYVARGMVDRPAAPVARAATPAGAAQPAGGILTDDDGATDLSKVQIVAFTAIAVLVYVVRLATQGDAATLPVMVDIDPALMTLMGLSHAGYLGAKIATRDAAAPAADHGRAHTASPGTGVK